MSEAKTMNKSQKRVHDVAANDKKAKAAGYGSHHERVRTMQWKAFRFVSCVSVVVYVFFDYVVKWF